MKQPIVGYDRDELGDWRAILACGHRQHVRHNPPLVERPWVLTEAGRREFLGHLLDCKRCDDEVETSTPKHKTSQAGGHRDQILSMANPWSGCSVL